MSDIKIYCKGCNKFLGVIRDGNLYIKIVHLCDTCNTKREALELRYKNEKSGDIFNDIFGGKL